MNIHTNRLDGGPFIHLARWLKHTEKGTISTKLKRGNWILNYASFLTGESLKGFKYIVYNTEILKHKFKTHPDYKRFLEGASMVWDYSPKNVEWFPVIYKPFGFYPCQQIEPKKKDGIFVFTG